MDVVIGFVSIGVAAALGIASLTIALLARRDAHRSANAAVAAAASAERQVELTQQQVDAEAARAAPDVDVLVLECRHSSSDLQGTTIVVSYVVHNSSSRPDTVRDIEVFFEGAIRAASSGALRPLLTDPQERLIPIILTAGDQVRRELKMSVRRLPDEPGNLPATLTAVCANAGRVSSAFTVYQRH